MTDDEYTEDHRRFVDALPRVQMALAEVGIQTRLVDEVLRFPYGTDRAVLAKACQVCGIGDLWDEMELLGSV